MSKLRKSFIEKRKSKRRAIFIILCVVIVFVVFSLVSKYLARPCIINSDAMEPSFSNGDCLIITPIGKTKELFEKHNSSDDFVRGQAVLLNPLYENEQSKVSSVFTNLSAFVSFQKFFPFSGKVKIGGRPMIRRLVAFPGEEIYMQDYVLYIKPVGENHFLTEYELSGQEYDIKIQNTLENWTSEMPFSDSFEKKILADDEFFVLCDNRSIGSDSRYWDKLTQDDIVGHVVLRYWPFSEFKGYR